MKKLYTFFVFVTVFLSFFLTSTSMAQAPQKMSYQAVVRNTANDLIKSSNIGMQVSILQGSATGTPVFVERHYPTTNSNGLVTIEIGGGLLISGNFATIDWSSGPYYVKTETDLNGGANYTISGTSQLLSIPYALYAKTVASYPETDPVFVAWNKSTGISINASQVSDFQTSVTNNTTVLANTAKITNATHTGDATGATALTVVRINGTSLAGLATGILKNTTSTGIPSIAIAGIDYLTPTGSAALLTNFPTLNQNTTGNAATVTTNANLTGEVTSTGNATTITNSAVIGKVLTGYVSGAGTVSASDNILQAIQKLNGNNPAHYIGESFGGGIVFYVYDNGRHGLITATADQSTGVVWTNTAFQTTVSNAMRDGINGGLANTERIIIQAGAGSYAAQLCANYKSGNYADWYLPSKYELNLLYLQKGVVGGFANYYYLSSTEVNDSHAWVQTFDGGNQGSNSKSLTNYVRAIRAF